MDRLKGGKENMNRREIILAAFGPAKGGLHTPVQVQKLLFLIDKEIPELVNGPHYNFQPYYYGPFDSTVYDELLTLADDDLVDVIPENTWYSYRLNKSGQVKGEEIFNSLPSNAQQFINSVSDFVRSLSFAQLVSAIYKAYPDMQANSVFQSCE